MPLAQCSPLDPPQAISDGLGCFPPVPDQRQPSPSRVLLRTGAWRGAGGQALFPHLEPPDERCTSAQERSGGQTFPQPLRRCHCTLNPSPSRILDGCSLRLAVWHGTSEHGLL